MRLIDADKLIETTKHMYCTVCNHNGDKDRCRACFVDDFFAMLRDEDDSPTVDAVEVVRCKDCKWYQEGELLAPSRFCFRLKHPQEDRSVGYNFGPNDFCSYGERR